MSLAYKYNVTSRASMDPTSEYHDVENARYIARRVPSRTHGCEDTTLGNTIPASVVGEDKNTSGGSALTRLLDMYQNGSSS